MWRTTTIRPETYKQLKAALSDDTGRQLSSTEDRARLRRLEKYSLVYLVKDGAKVQQFILPVRGKGLWSTMFAYVALDGDLTTIRGISFYEHGETPGLGGEVENTRWQDGWRGKRVYDESGQNRPQRRQRQGGGRGAGKTIPDRRLVGCDAHHQGCQQPHGILVR